MKNILIFGGTQYVGKQLTGLLLAKNYNVTIASRGNFPVPYGENVRHVKLDRYDPSSFPQEINRDWDLIIDQLAFFPDDAKILIDYFGDKAKHYLMVSSSAVYHPSLNCRENDFDPTSFQIEYTNGPRAEVIPDTEMYNNGKRGAEAVYAQLAKNYTIVRFPKILGVDDLTHRLLELVMLIKNQKPIHVSSLSKKYSFIHSRDAVRLLSWVIDKPFIKIINGTSLGVETAESLMTILGGEPTKLSLNPNQELNLFRGHEIILNTELATREGFIFEKNSDWLKEVSSFMKFNIESITRF